MPILTKRLIEVDLPIKAISAHARREKSIRHGHISTLHIWWARRPLAACRAVICAALWLDPVDDSCPQAFRDAIVDAFRTFSEMMNSDKQVAGLSPSLWNNWSVKNILLTPPDNPDCWMDMRYTLLHFIADFANWDASTNPTFLETARILTQAAHESLGGIPGTHPLVVDPFAGGGAIPLEALRVGADAYASDLNPVAVLLNKVVLEYIPRYAKTEMTVYHDTQTSDPHDDDKPMVLHGLAEAVRYWGTWIKQQAEAELTAFYPKDPDGATPIAYLWARTITCEGPGCGAEIPLMRSLWLAKKSKNSVALRIVPNPAAKRVDFTIIEQAKAKDVGEGTVNRGSATCPCCGFTTPVASVRKQMKARQGGAADARLFCVVTTKPDTKGRFYRLPTERDLEAIRKAADELEKRKREHTATLSLVPDEPLPPPGTLGFRVQRYGMEQWGDLFTSRQLLSLTTLARLVREGLPSHIADHTSDEQKGFVDAVQTCLALAVDRLADFNSSLARWANHREGSAGTFGRQALPIVWDFGETSPISNSTGAFETSLDLVVNILEMQNSNTPSYGQAFQNSSIAHKLSNDIAHAFITDPPYYDAVPYSDLSDFFYVWLKRTLPRSALAAFTDALTPKDDECIVDEVKGKDHAFFEHTMEQAMAEGCRILNPDGIGIVVFAHKSTSGWEAQLQAMVNAGWKITGSWPIDTEMGTRLRARDSAALASSVHLACRRRHQTEDEAELIGDWREVLQELPQCLRKWLPRLTAEGVVGADAIFACLGPALEIFSRYDIVEKPNGDSVKLGEYLEHVWANVSQEALSILFKEAESSGLEPDARLTAMWLWTIAANTSGSNGDSNGNDSGDGDGEKENGTKGTQSASFTLDYDTARKIAQGLGANLDTMPYVVEVKGSSARLLSVEERTRYLFGKTDQMVPQKRQAKKPPQISMFAEIEQAEEEPSNSSIAATPAGKTLLDRVHQVMIFFATGRSSAMKQFISEHGLQSNHHFWQLAQTLSALYPTHTEEKRWVDGVLAQKKGMEG